MVGFLTYISKKIIFNVTFSILVIEKVSIYVIQNLFLVYKIFKYFLVRLKTLSSRLVPPGFLYKSRVKFSVVVEGTVYLSQCYILANVISYSFFFLVIYIYDIARFIPLRAPTDSLIHPNIISLASGYTLTATYNNIPTELPFVVAERRDVPRTLKILQK